MLTQTDGNSLLEWFTGEQWSSLRQVALFWVAPQTRGSVTVTNHLRAPRDGLAIQQS